MKFSNVLICGILSTAFLFSIPADAQTQSIKAKKAKSVTTVKKNKRGEMKKIDTHSQHESIARAKAAQEAAAARVAELARQQAEQAERDKPIVEAETLMQASKPAEAYALLEPLEFYRSGEVRFDYLLGIAALDSGKADKATLAFERVLALEPNFAGARLDMARAYYQLGDLPRAKTEFESVLDQNPPEAAKMTIQKYLDAIRAYEDAKQTRISAYVEGVMGHDSNVNNSTAQSQIPIPAFGNLVFTLSPTNLQSSDNYAGLAGGAEASHSYNQNWGVYAGADARQRSNFTMGAFDAFSVDGRAGITYTSEFDMVRVGLSAGQFTLGNDRNRVSTGLMADWQHSFSPVNQINLFTQYGRNRFVDPALQVNDFDQSVIGAGWMHVMNDGKAVAFVSYFLGNENDVAPAGRADGNKRFDGIRMGGQAVMGESWDAFASIGVQWGKYDKTNAAFLVQRSDRQEDMSVGINWHPAQDWTVRPQLMWSRNHSNIIIYGYDRTDISVTVRRDFR